MSRPNADGLDSTQLNSTRGNATLEYNPFYSQASAPCRLVLTAVFIASGGEAAT